MNNIEGTPLCYYFLPYSNKAQQYKQIQNLIHTLNADYVINTNLTGQTMSYTHKQKKFIYNNPQFIDQNFIYYF